MIILLATIVVLALPMTLFGAARVAHATAGEACRPQRLWKRTMALQLPALGLVYALALAWASSTVRADTPPVAARPPAESQAARGGGLTVGDGLAMLGIALATAVSVLGTGYAVAVVGASALGAITEKPELFGRTLVFIGLAEGLAIYGLIISILLLERVR